MSISRDQLIEQVRAAFAQNGRPAPERVLAAMGRVPREAYVPSELAGLAYLNRPLPIGFEQTISQPFIVALMTGLLQLRCVDKVLEIGSGSGYQAAVLAELAHKVFSIERVAPLADAAARRLEQLGYRNVRVRAGDGDAGWPEAAPFDAVIATAAAPEVPPALVAQLARGGRLVLPLELADGEQQLTVVHKVSDGSVRHEAILPVRFVPLLPGERREEWRAVEQA